MKYNLVKIKSADLTDDEKAIDVTMTISGQNPLREMFQIVRDMKEGEKYSVSIDKKIKKRSLDANSYAWSLIQKLAIVLNLPKEKVYREIIRGWGDFYCITLSESDAAALADKWSTKGIGWIAEPLWTNCGQTCLMLYPGSSTYDTKQMSRFIDAIIDECREQGIETMEPEQLKSLIEGW